MDSFYYKAVDDEGSVSEGRRVARDRESLNDYLDQQGLTLVKLEHQSSYWLHPVNHKERLSRFFRNLYLFLKSGMELLPALELVKDRVDSDQTRACVETIVDDLKKGQSFGDALQSCDPFFPPAAHRICAVAEETGNLTEACDELAEYYNSQYEFFSDVYSMLLYPLIVLVVGFGITVFLFSFVVPRLKTVVPDDQSLPILSKVVFTLGDFMNGAGFWIVLGTAVGVPFLLYWFYNTRWFKQLRNSLLTYSGLYRRIKAQLFCLSMAMSTRVGMEITRSLQLARDVLANPWLKNRMENVIEDVRQGQTLTDSLAEGGFDEFALDSLRAGEESGNLQEVFQYQAEMLSEDINRRLDRILTVVEPVVILIMALFVGVIMAAILLPIMNLSSGL